MPFPFTCPTCRHASQVPDQFAGAQAKCPSCGMIIGIPVACTRSTTIRKSIPVIPKIDDDIPVVRPMEPPAAPPVAKNAGTVVILIVLTAGGMATLFCCGVGVAFAYWLLDQNRMAQSSQAEREVALAPQSAPPVATSNPASSLAPDADMQPPSYWTQRLIDANPAEAGKAHDRLLRMARKAVPELRRASRGHDVKLKLAAVSLLGEIGPEAVHAWNDISANLTAPEAELRLAAAEALGKLGMNANPCLPRLLMAAPDADPRVRAAVLDSLEKVGPPAKEDIPNLLALWHEANSGKRTVLVSAVQKLTLDPRTTAILFVPLLHDPAKPIRLTAIEALGDAGPSERAKTYPKLLPILDDLDADIRKHAMTAMRKLGAATSADRPQLETGLHGRSVEIRIYCLESLGGLGSDARPSLPLIARRTTDLEPAVRLAAVKALGQFGKAAVDVADELLISRRDSEASVRIEAINSLSAISREHGIMQALFDSLADSNVAVGQAAAIAIRAAQAAAGQE